MYFCLFLPPLSSLFLSVCPLRNWTFLLSLKLCHLYHQLMDITDWLQMPITIFVKRWPLQDFSSAFTATAMALCREYRTDSVHRCSTSHMCLCPYNQRFTHITPIQRHTVSFITGWSLQLVSCVALVTTKAFTSFAVAPGTITNSSCRLWWG